MPTERVQECHAYFTVPRRLALKPRSIKSCSSRRPFTGHNLDCAKILGHIERRDFRQSVRGLHQTFQRHRHGDTHCGAGHARRCPRFVVIGGGCLRRGFGCGAGGGNVAKPHRWRPPGRAGIGWRRFESAPVSPPPPSKAQLDVILREGNVSITAELRSMVREVKNGHADGTPLLVELKGVDRQYPLYGAVKILPALNLTQMLDQNGGVYGVVANLALFDALGLEPGDYVQVGGARYQLRGVLVVEPDRAFRAFTLGPRVMVLSKSLPATGVTDEGAEIYFYTRVRLPPKSAVRADAKAALARIDQALPESGWRGPWLSHRYCCCLSAWA